MGVARREFRTRLFRSVCLIMRGLILFALLLLIITIIGLVLFITVFDRARPPRDDHDDQG